MLSETMFEDPKIKMVTEILESLSARLLEDFPSPEDLPHQVRKHLCSLHPTLSNYSTLIDLKAEEASLVPQLETLQKLTRSILHKPLPDISL